MNYSENILSVVLDSAYEGVVLVDKDGIIIFINKAYCNILGLKKEDAIGRHCTEVIDNTKLHIVLETGIPERGKLQTIAGQEMIVHRLPVWENNEIVAAIGMLVFEGVSELYEIMHRIEGEERTAPRHRLPNRKEKADEPQWGFDHILGRSEPILETKRLARKAAKTLATVLITGESGTGKELFAKAIHASSPFADGNFVSVNCAAIPEHLLEAEWFGYEEGAFTGAKKGGKPGIFELADNGTLFLDEVGDMPLTMQAKILRVLQEREAVRLGGLKAYPINARMIAATNKDLFQMVKEKKFREDLYYRLNIIPIRIPPLRERKEDVPLILSAVLEESCSRYKLEKKQVTAEALARLMKYDWPGNVREMVNVVEQLVSLVDKEWITPAHLPKWISGQAETEIEPLYANHFQAKIKHMKLAEERDIIMQALIEEKGNKARAAKKLGIHRSTLYEKLKKLNFTQG